MEAAIGYEKLGAETGGRFVTPLATLHAFNGWADQFLAAGTGNPVDGLADRFGKITVKASERTSAQLAWHDFESDRNRRDLGQELNVSLSHEFSKHVKAGVFYADFNGAGGLRDSRKAWLMITVSFQ